MRLPPMPALPRWSVALACALVASGGAQAVEVALALPKVARPLPQPVRFWTTTEEPAELFLCDDDECALLRALPTTPAPEGGVLAAARLPHPFLIAHTTTPPNRMQSYSPQIANGPGATHLVAVYGAVDVAASHAATWAREVDGAEGSRTWQPAAGGVSPVEATAALEGDPALVMLFDAVTLGTGAPVSPELGASLERFVASGGLIVVDEGDAHGLVPDGLGFERLSASAPLMEIASQRVLAEGERDLDARFFPVGAGGWIARAPRADVADALLAAAPRFRDAQRLAQVDPRHLPSTGAAAIAAAYPQRAAHVLLPTALALGLAALALVVRRRTGALLGRPVVLASVVASGALVVVPALLDGGGESEVRTYLALHGARVALEEGAVAARPARLGEGSVSLTAPIGTVPVVDLRGRPPAAQQRLALSDGGRTVALDVEADTVAVAAWARHVDLERGLVVNDGGPWPEAVRDLVVENRLPFALDHLVVVSQSGAVSLAAGAGLEAGARARVWIPRDDVAAREGERSDDPRDLARASLQTALEARCRGWTSSGESPACVVATGTAPDGALVGVQVLSP